MAPLQLIKFFIFGIVCFSVWVVAKENSDLFGVTVEVMKAPGNCEQTAKSGDLLTVHYNGSFAHNQKKFDSSHNRGVPLNFQLGFGEVITGWEKGLVGMCKGEIRRLTIPPHLAYGSKGTTSPCDLQPAQRMPKGQEHPGGDISHGVSFNVASADDCCKICLDNENCVAYEWLEPAPQVPYAKTCWLKEVKPAVRPHWIVMAQGHVFYGEVLGTTTTTTTLSPCDLHPAQKMPKGQEHPGSDISHGVSFNVASADDCCEICLNNEDCVAYEWLEPAPQVPYANTCWLKEAIPAVQPHWIVLAQGHVFYGEVR